MKILGNYLELFCQQKIEKRLLTIIYGTNNEGILIVKKGFDFVYSPCNNVIKPDSVVVLQGNEYGVIEVVNDTFNLTRDLVCLSYAPDFN